MRQPRSTQEGLTWSAWESTWLMHASSRGFRSKLESAKRIAAAGAQKASPMFLAMSGGKDSVATAGVLWLAGIEVPWIHTHCDLHTEGMLECAERACDVLGADLEVVESELDVWDFLRSLPADRSILDEELHYQLRTRFASGNMLVATQYARGFKGAFSGMRAEESRARAMNHRTRGHTYQIKVDGTWLCHPIAEWSARDVFALLVSEELPIHSHYRRLYERFGISPESPASRVDSLLTEERISARGALVHARVLYPTLWAKITEARPELTRHD